MSNLKYNIFTLVLLIVFPPAGIAMICSKRNRLALLAKILIIIFDLMWLTIICLLLIYSR